VNRTFIDLDALPLRFNPPDGWRTPNAQWVSLYQGFQPPPDWSPYPDPPPIPSSWPWWEENGTSWFRFFRDRAPIPARALGNWFSLAALGLFTLTVSPFALDGWFIATGGIVGLVLIILGIRGVVRTMKNQAGMPLDPLETIQAWSVERRRKYFLETYQALRGTAPQDHTMEEFVRAQISHWWGETAAGAES